MSTFVQIGKLQHFYEKVINGSKIPNIIMAAFIKQKWRFTFIPIH